jgi:hypothetical protein
MAWLLKTRETDSPAWFERRQSKLYLYRDPGPRPGHLYLPGVKTVVYTVDGRCRRGGLHVQRQRRVAQYLTKFGFASWSFFFGRKADPSWKSSEGYAAAIVRDWAKLLRENDPPFLILEDDAEPVDFAANLLVAPDCQIAMLGGGRGGDRRGTDNAVADGLRPIMRYRYSYLPFDEHWFRVFGMWYTHAYLFLCKRAVIDLALCCESAGGAIDTITAREQWRWQVHCRRKPMFWQNDGHHFRDTFSY